MNPVDMLPPTNTIQVLRFGSGSQTTRDVLSRDRVLDLMKTFGVRQAHKGACQKGWGLEFNNDGRAGQLWLIQTK